MQQPLGIDASNGANRLQEGVRQQHQRFRLQVSPPSDDHLLAVSTSWRFASASASAAVATFFAARVLATDKPSRAAAASSLAPATVFPADRAIQEFGPDTLPVIACMARTINRRGFNLGGQHHPSNEDPVLVAKYQ